MGTGQDAFNKHIAWAKECPECTRLKALGGNVVKRIIVLEAFKRNYRCIPEEDAHCSYQNRLHDPETDEQVSWHDLIYDVMRQVPEGNIVRIVIEDTEKKSDYADDWWCLLAPHNYGPHSAIGG